MIKANTIKRIIPFIVALALFMEAVDTTIINTAIPSMAQSLRVSVIDLKIALISYLLSLAIFIPISGWLADRYGTRRIFMTASVIFTLSSFVCGLSTNLYELIIARFIQGVGGAFMIPVGRLLILRVFHRREYLQAINRVVVPALIGPALGPLLGGVISQAISWRWIFWVNIPFGILIFIFAFIWMPNFKIAKRIPFDFIGFLLFGLGLAGFVFGLSALSESGFPKEFLGWTFSISLSLLFIYGFYAMRIKYPVLQIKLFKTRTFRISIIGNLLTRLGFGGMPFLLPLFLQIALSYSPQKAGFIVAFTALGAMLTKFFTQKITTILGFKTVLIMNTIAIGLATWIFLLVHPGTMVLIIIFFSLLFGTFMSLQFSAMNPLSQADLRREERSNGSSILTMMQQIASSFGVAFTALILKHFELDGANPQSLQLTDFYHAFFILGLVTILSSSIFLFLKKEDGRNLTHPN